MNYESLNKEEWKRFFDGLSKCLETREDIDLKFISPLVGDQVVDNDVSLQGITYDERFDSLFVSLVGSEHQIRKPSKVVLGEYERSLMSISIEDSDGGIHQIEFNSPIWLDTELLKNNSRTIPPHEIHV